MTCCGNVRRERLTPEEKFLRLRAYYDHLRGRILKKIVKRKNER
jgi:hypothetical protein